jgi:hypothetical protein
VTIELADGSTRGFDVGAETPLSTTQYIRLPGETTVLVVSKYGLDGVLGLLEDVLATPTPTASETLETPAERPSATAAPETGSPATGATGTPEP